MDEDFDFDEPEATEPSDGMDGDLAFPELAGQEAIDDAKWSEVERAEQAMLRAAGITVDRNGSYVSLDEKLRRRGWR